MRWLIEEESGQGMTEYALLMVLLVAALVTATSMFGIDLAAEYEELANTLP